MLRPNVGDSTNWRCIFFTFASSTSGSARKDVDLQNVQTSIAHFSPAPLSHIVCACRQSVYTSQSQRHCERRGRLQSEGKTLMAGIKLTHVDLSSTSTTTRLTSEQRAAAHTVDVVIWLPLFLVGLSCARIDRHVYVSLIVVQRSKSAIFPRRKVSTIACESLASRAQDAARHTRTHIACAYSRECKKSAREKETAAHGLHVTSCRLPPECPACQNRLRMLAPSTVRRYEDDIDDRTDARPPVYSMLTLLLHRHGTRLNDAPLLLYRRRIDALVRIISRRRTTSCRLH